MKSIVYKILTVVILAIFAFSIFLWYSKPDQTESTNTVDSGYNEDLPTGNDTPKTSASQETTNPNNTTQTNTDTKPVTTDTKSKYKDGTYTVTANYGTPAGTEELLVTLVIKNDVVVDSTVTNEASDRTSKNFEDKFISGYKAQVVGKSVDSIKLGVVSGSSLTPNGFNSALSTIKKQAAN